MDNGAECVTHHPNTQLPVALRNRSFSVKLKTNRTILLTEWGDFNCITVGLALEASEIGRNGSGCGLPKKKKKRYNKINENYISMYIFARSRTGVYFQSVPNGNFVCVRRRGVRRPL